MRPGQIERRSYAEVRNGTITPFVTPNVRTREMPAGLYAGHRQENFPRLLLKMARTYAGVQNNLLYDNQGTRYHREVQLRCHIVSAFTFISPRPALAG
jgi:hypothetical protein